MSDRLGMVCGFLGGTIVAVEEGYKVFPHPKPDKIYNRLSDAKWFLALQWCDHLSDPAGIVNNTGEMAFLNQIVLDMGEANFIPPQYRLTIFDLCLPLQPNETICYQLPANGKSLEIQGLLIDARYGKVALVREIAQQ
ncbi:MAG: hypothetical protein AAFQ14_05345 [Cyanobacteria bacterium J06621_12]